MAPFERIKCSAVECGNREEACRGGITETVAIPQMERIDGQTAPSFLCLLSFAERELDTIRSPSVSAG